MSSLQPDFEAYLLNYQDVNSFDDINTKSRKYVSELSRNERRNHTSSTKTNNTNVQKNNGNSSNIQKRQLQSANTNSKKQKLETKEDNNQIDVLFNNQSLLELFQYESNAKTVPKECSTTTVSIQESPFYSEYNPCLIPVVNDSDYDSNDDSSDDESFTDDQLDLIETVMSHNSTTQEIYLSPEGGRFSHDTTLDYHTRLILDQNINKDSIKTTMLVNDVSYDASELKSFYERNSNVSDSRLLSANESSDDCSDFSYPSNDQQDEMAQTPHIEDENSLCVKEKEITLTEEFQETKSIAQKPIVFSSSETVKTLKSTNNLSTKKLTKTTHIHNKDEGLGCQSMNPNPKKSNEQYDCLDVANNITGELRQCQDAGKSLENTHDIPCATTSHEKEKTVKHKISSKMNEDVFDKNKEKTTSSGAKDDFSVGGRTKNIIDKHVSSKNEIQGKNNDSNTKDIVGADERTKNIINVNTFSCTNGKNKTQGYTKYGKIVKDVANIDSDSDAFVDSNDFTNNKMITSTPLHNQSKVNTRGVGHLCLGFNESQYPTTEISKKAIDYLLDIDESDVDDAIESMLSKQSQPFDAFSAFLNPQAFGSKKVDKVKNICEKEVDIETELCEVTIDSTDNCSEEEEPFLPPSRSEVKTENVIAVTGSSEVELTTKIKSKPKTHKDKLKKCTTTALKTKKSIKQKNNSENIVKYLNKNDLKANRKSNNSSLADLKENRNEALKKNKLNQSMTSITKKQELLSKFIDQRKKMKLVIPLLPIKSKKNFKVLPRSTEQNKSLKQQHNTINNPVKPMPISAKDKLQSVLKPNLNNNLSSPKKTVTDIVETSSNASSSDWSNNCTRPEPDLSDVKTNSAVNNVEAPKLSICNAERPECVYIESKNMNKQFSAEESMNNEENIENHPSQSLNFDSFNTSVENLPHNKIVPKITPPSNTNSSLTQNSNLDIKTKHLDCNSNNITVCTTETTNVENFETNSEFNIIDDLTQKETIFENKASLNKNIVENAPCKSHNELTHEDKKTDEEATSNDSTDNNAATVNSLTFQTVVSDSSDVNSNGKNNDIHSIEIIQATKDWKVIEEAISNNSTENASRVKCETFQAAVSASSDINSNDKLNDIRSIEIIQATKDWKVIEEAISNSSTENFSRVKCETFQAAVSDSSDIISNSITSFETYQSTIDTKAVEEATNIESTGNNAARVTKVPCQTSALGSSNVDSNVTTSIKPFQATKDGKCTIVEPSLLPHTSVSDTTDFAEHNMAENFSEAEPMSEDVSCQCDTYLHVSSQESCNIESTSADRGRATRKRNISSSECDDVSKVKKPKCKMKEKAIKYYKDKIKQYKNKALMFDWTSDFRQEIQHLKKSIKNLKKEVDKQKLVILNQDESIQRLNHELSILKQTKSTRMIPISEERQDATITSSDNDVNP